MADEDYLMNYDPEGYEVHMDSSSFDIENRSEKRTPQKTKKKERKRRGEDERVIKNMLYFDNCGIEFLQRDKCKGDLKKTKAERPYQDVKPKNNAPRQHVQMAYDVENRRLGTVYSKSLLRHKVMPCLSRIFNRHRKQVTQLYAKFSKDQVFNAEEKHSDLHRYGTFLINDKHDDHKGLPSYQNYKDFLPTPERSPHSITTQYSYSSCDLTSSHELNKLNSCYCNQFEVQNLKDESFGASMEIDIKEESTKNQTKVFTLTKSQSQQYPSEHGTFCVLRNDAQKLFNHNIPSKSSEFWDFCMNIIYEIYQSKKICPQCKKDEPPKLPDNCTDIPEPKEANPNCPQECPLKMSLEKPAKDIQTTKLKCECPKKSRSKRRKKEELKNKLLCKTSSPLSTDSKESGGCQKPHGELKKTLKKKFNKEILCIHNPPFVLINGCLKIPGKADPSHFEIFNMYDKLDNGCQFSNHYQSAFQCQTSVTKTKEEVSQGVCSHAPPCEVVPCCWRPKHGFTPKEYLQEMPDVQQKDSDQSEQGKDIEKSNDSNKSKGKEYIVLTARDNVCTQVKPQCVCRHEPKCIQIPKCLSKAIYSDMASSKFPRCIHKPTCDMIPACCRRRPKVMVSTSSQFPGSCRMV